MQIADKSVVAIDYTLKDEDGEVIDSSDGGDPLYYLHGSQNIIPGLETELTGKSAGDSLKVTVQPADGYGELNPQLKQTRPRSEFEGVDDLKVGMRFRAQTEAGIINVVIAEIDGDEITLDANHELAGKVLNFDVTVKEVREATEEEITHGHVHGPGGHHH
jgi:FKBP-type peptidyl-prolyl cis-trans isomerase SlyD